VCVGETVGRVKAANDAGQPRREGAPVDQRATVFRGPHAEVELVLTVNGRTGFSHDESFASWRAEPAASWARARPAARGRPEKGPEKDPSKGIRSLKSDFKFGDEVRTDLARRAPQRQAGASKAKGSS